MTWAARDSYELTVDADPFVAWLNAKRRDWEIFVADDAATLLHQEAGEASYYPDGMSRAEAITGSQQRIERYRNQVEILSALLGRFETTEAVG